MRVGNQTTMLTSICLLWISILNQLAPGEEVVSPGVKDRFGTPANGHRIVVGVNNKLCWKCHRDGSRDDGNELPADLKGLGNDGWYLGDELSTWAKHDFHYQAFSVLLNEQSRQMAKSLGIVDENGKSAVHQDRRCLSCHTSIPVDQMPLVDDRVTLDTTKDVRYTIGVSCEACHGPAGQLDGGPAGWEDTHFVNRRWRTMTPQAKFDEFGYWDIHTPRTQTRICLSCHMGNVEQKKVITHEMYAAGHPPLPSFELSQFVNQMPRHWRRVEEKPRSARDKFVAELEQLNMRDNFNLIGENEVAATKLTMISGLVTLEESMNLTADLITDPANSQQWPELANYSCFACHHELSRDGWRKKTRLSKFPGRPTLHEWPFALSSVVMQEIPVKAGELPFQHLSDAVITAMTARPYGDPLQLKLTAKALAKRIEIETERLNKITIDQQNSIRFLTNIAVDGSTKTTDYDSARQFVWAYERTFNALEKPSRPDDIAPPQEKMPNSQRWIGEWIGSNPILDEFKQDLVLWLRANRSEDAPVKLGPNKDAFQRTQRSTNISESLKKIAEYQPHKTNERFQQLRTPPVKSSGDAK